ncbi:MAG: lasso RiPP family leader peptide-containing protein [Acidobacteria bacterium]|nr:lasso RiPP family leader peptide-containing protein [Acidobacteriota bacterium]
MTKTPEAQESSSLVLQPDEKGSPRKPYESPVLMEWGSIVELTGGPFADITDEGFNGGSGGV